MLSSSKKILSNNPGANNSNEFPVVHISSVNLFTFWYEEGNKKRKDELIACIKKNVENELIGKIYLIVENGIKVPIKNDKIVIVDMLKRPTYSDVFKIVNSITTTDEINIIANTDIYFLERDISLMHQINWNNLCLALTRWDDLENGDIKFHGQACSQDVWIFKGAIKEINGGFNLGVPGCDNRIAWEIEQAGYDIINPSLDVKSYHLHNSGVRKYDLGAGKVTHRIEKPYKSIEPTKLLVHRNILGFKKKSKTVFHLGLSLNFQKSLVLELKNLGNYYSMDWREEISSIGYENFVIKLYKAIADSRPDIIFMQIQTENIITSKIINTITRIVPDVKIVNWNGDIRNTTPNWMIELAKFYHVYTAFSNMRDVENMIQKGYSRTFFLQIGIEETVFNATLYEKNKLVPPIIFTGTLYPDFELYSLRMEMVMRLTERYGTNFAAYGGGLAILGHFPTLSKEKTAHLYKSTKFCISVNNINAKKYSSDRLFNILSCGGFALVHYYEGIEDDLTDGVHAVYWKSVDQLIEKIEYYKEHEDERKRIAAAGYDLAWNKFTWHHRFGDLRKKLGIENE